MAALGAFVRDIRTRAEPYVDRGRASIVGRVWERLLEVTFLETSVALAAKAFVALLPLLITVAAVAPAFVRQAIISSLRQRMGLGAANQDVISGAFESPDEIRQATGVVGLLFLFFYATTFSSALQRVYLRAWRRPKRGGLRNTGRGILWIAGLLVTVALFGGLRRIAVGAPATVGALLLSMAAGTVVWWWTAWVLLRGDVRWRTLLPGALLTMLGMYGYALWSQLWMPHVVRSNSEQFGFFGVALSLVSWFVGVSFIIVFGAAINAVLAEDPGVLGRLTRGRSGLVLRPGAPPALPEPITGPRLLDAMRPSADES